MIFYLENEMKFHLYYDNANIIFLLYSNGIHDPKVEQRRWRDRIFGDESDHLPRIVDRLRSEDEEDRELGKKMLEQSLNVRINGRIVGHYEGASI